MAKRRKPSPPPVKPILDEQPKGLYWVKVSGVNHGLAFLAWCSGQVVVGIGELSAVAVPCRELRQMYGPLTLVAPREMCGDTPEGIPRRFYESLAVQLSARGQNLDDVLERVPKLPSVHPDRVDINEWMKNEQATNRP